MNKGRKAKLLLLLLLLLTLLGLYFYLMQTTEAETGAEQEEEEHFQVTKIDPSLVSQLGIINGEETIDLSKEGDEWHSYEDETVSIDAEAVSAYLSAAGELDSENKIEEVSDFSQYGLDKPALNITLLWDSNMYNIKVGDYNSMISRYYVCVNDEKVVYTITATQFYALNKTLADFKKKEN